MLRVIERVTRQQLEEMKMPSVADVNELRVVKFKEKIQAAVLSGHLREAFYRDIVAAQAAVLPKGVKS